MSSELAMKVCYASLSFPGAKLNKFRELEAWLARPFLLKSVKPGVSELILPNSWQPSSYLNFRHSFLDFVH